jgi:hypothetical protein
MRVMNSWPIAAGTHIHSPRGPEVANKNAKVVNMPLAIEMNEKPMANDVNDFRERSNCGLYPDCSSSGLDALMKGSFQIVWDVNYARGGTLIAQRVVAASSEKIAGIPPVCQKINGDLSFGA